MRPYTVDISFFFPASLLVRTLTEFSEKTNSIRMTISAKKTKNLQLLWQRSQPPKNRNQFRPYESVKEFKYLGMTLSNRGLITPTLKALEKRMTICMLTIHKLPHNLVNLITRLDIFGVYIQPHFISCLVALVFIPKTTIYAFYIHFLTT